MEELAKLRSSLDDIASIRKVRGTYGGLHDLLRNLSRKLTSLSSNIDSDFLSSYRVHMLAIQSEIKTLKQDLVKAEQALKNDNSVAKLEAEVNWFKGTLKYAKKIKISTKKLCYIHM